MSIKARNIWIFDGVERPATVDPRIDLTNLETWSVAQLIAHENRLAKRRRHELVDKIKCTTVAYDRIDDYMK